MLNDTYIYIYLNRAPRQLIAHEKEGPQRWKQRNDPLDPVRWIPSGRIPRGSENRTRESDLTVLQPLPTCL